MAQLSLRQEAVAETAKSAGLTWRQWTHQWPTRLLLLLLALQLTIPMLIWKGGLPGALDWLQEFVAAIIVLVTLLYMLANNRLPMAMLIVLGVTLIWGLVAIFEGQSVVATAWGWFKFFKYPMIGLFAYLVMDWPEDFADGWMKLLVGLMAFEVGVQLVQLATGQPPGDSLAGTFGRKGVGPQTMFNLLVICFAFGHWIVTRRWKLLTIALVLGLVSSMLNITKFYIPAIILLGAAALVFYMLRGGQIRQLLLSIIVFAVLAAAFVPIFNQFIATTRGLPTLQEYFEPQKLEGYLFNDGSGGTDGQYRLGRGLSLAYGWQLIQRDSTSLLFGMGLGTRSASVGLGISGIGLETDLYGGASGTGLLIMLQEMGIGGLLAFLGFILWIVWVLLRDSRRHDDLSLASLQMGLVMFTSFWPLWLWYKKPWSFDLVMIVYWVTLGFVFSQMAIRRRQDKPSRRWHDEHVSWEDNNHSAAQTKPRQTSNGHSPDEREPSIPPYV